MPEATTLPKTAEELSKFVAEAKRAEAEAEAAHALARKTVAEAEEAEHKAAKARIDLDREVEKRDKELRAEHRHYRYLFSQSVSESSVKACIEQLNDWHRQDPACEIEITFDSPGGSVTDGMHLFDHIVRLRHDGHKVTTVAQGMAASMAGILLQSGDVRAMSENAMLMIHEASFGAAGKMGDVEDTVEMVKLYHDRILDIFATRSKMTKAQLRSKWRRKNWWITSGDALKRGLVDEVWGLDG